MLLDHPKPLRNLLRDDYDKNQYKKDLYKMNITPLKNFSVYGRYSNKKPENGKNNGNVLRRAGSSIFENNYKIDEDTDPHVYNHNIYPNYAKRPIIEKVKNDFNLDNLKHNINKQTNN